VTRPVAEANLEYLRVARELKYHASLYDFLAHQLEAVRIDKAQNALSCKLSTRPSSEAQIQS